MNMVKPKATNKLDACSTFWYEYGVFFLHGIHNNL